jgi:predicted extracellular nuclease
VSQLVKTSGIVTAKFFGTSKIGGYFIQDPVGDGNPLTSDGIFVSTGTDNVTVGDNVEITGTVTETGGRTQLGTVTNTSLISSNNPLPLVTVHYDASSWNWEQYEGMLIQFDQTLFVTGNKYLQLYGELTLNPVRNYTPTNQFVHGTPEYNALVAQNQKAQIILDDAITTTNYTPIQFADANGTRRMGERIDNLQAIVDCISPYNFIYPIKTPVFYGNPRPAEPSKADLGNCNLKVCAYNLEVYLADSYGTGFGPANATMAALQHTKIVAAMLAIDADIYGLIEIQEGQAALTKLITAMNEQTIAGRYGFVNDGGSPYGSYTKVGYLYRTDKVTPYSGLKSNTSPTYSTSYRLKEQAFTLKSNGERFTFSLNHFKAKTGCPTSGTDADQGDGQGCYNATRIVEATSTVNFITANKTYYNDKKVLVMGDLNAYGKEDPVQVFVNAGYTDLHRAYHADSAYSYIFNNEAGYLDNALASDLLRSNVTGVTVFHINSDEPAMFDYSGNNYQANMYRSSDHDPVIVGLSLGIVNDVKNINSEDKIKISPTVVNDYFVVSNAEGDVIQIFTTSGTLIKKEKVTSNEYTVSLLNLQLTSGVYFVRVLGTGNVKKIIVLNK